MRRLETGFVRYNSQFIAIVRDPAARRDCSRQNGCVVVEGIMTNSIATTITWPVNDRMAAYITRGISSPQGPDIKIVNRVAQVRLNVHEQQILSPVGATETSSQSAQMIGLAHPELTSAASARWSLDWPRHFYSKLLIGFVQSDCQPTGQHKRRCQWRQSGQCRKVFRNRDRHKGRNER